jgi:hypothetical protein
MFKVQRIAVIGIVTVAVVLSGCGRILGSSRDRADDAWSERLNAQAQAVQEQARDARARQAYTDRLTAEAEAYLAAKSAQAQADQAWTDRLNGLAGKTGMSDRAAAAWTARLNGLAEQYANGQ